MSCTRRRFLALAGAAVAVSPRTAYAQSGRLLTVAHGASTFVYAQHLVAREKHFFEAEGVSVPSFIVPGGGPKVAQALVAGQAMFALGDSNHPLKITEKGKDAAMIFATDTRCSYANVVVRNDLYDKGVTSVERLADAKLIGRRAVIAATAIGSGTYVYGVYVLQSLKASDGTPVNDHVDWVSGGASTTMLGGLNAGKFDAIMAIPEWQWAAEDEGFGKAIYDVRDDKAWTRVFGGPIPVTVGYTLRDTIEQSPDLVQAYVNACYRAQQWIRKTRDDEIVDLLHRPYMDTFARDVVLRSVKYYKSIFDWDFAVEPQGYENAMKVWVPLAVDKPISFARAVERSFVRQAQLKFKS